MTGTTRNNTFSDEKIPLQIVAYRHKNPFASGSQREWVVADGGVANAFCDGNMV